MNDADKPQTVAPLPGLNQAAYDRVMEILDDLAQAAHAQEVEEAQRDADLADGIWR